MEFKYQISDEVSPDEVEELFCSSRQPSMSEVIKVQKDANGTVMILGNGAGWLYLAKICVEMAYTAQRDPSFHIHRTEEFEISHDNSEDCIGFFQIGADLEAQIFTKRKGN